MIVWVSECGQYYAVPYKRSDGSGDYDVYTVDGKQCWKGRRYIPKGFEDIDPRHLYPEFPHMISMWHFEEIVRGKRTFTLHFCDTDPTVKIIPFTGNTVLRSYKATFKKKRAIPKTIITNSNLML